MQCELHPFFASMLRKLLSEVKGHEDIMMGRQTPKVAPAHFVAAKLKKRQTALKNEVRRQETKMLRRISAEKATQERRDYWQNWRTSSIAILQEHISKETTVQLLREPPQNMVIVSSRVREATLKKAMAVMFFLRTMHERDIDKSHFECGGKHALLIAADVAKLLGSSRTFVYKSYREWRQGEVTRLAAAKEANNASSVPLGFGSFEQARTRTIQKKQTPSFTAAVATEANNNATYPL